MAYAVTAAVAAGRGGLDPWLRAVLLRVALNLLGARPGAEPEHRGVAELAAPGPDPEASLLRRAEHAVLTDVAQDPYGWRDAIGRKVVVPFVARRPRDGARGRPVNRSWPRRALAGRFGACRVGSLGPATGPRTLESPGPCCGLCLTWETG